MYSEVALFKKGVENIASKRAISLFLEGKYRLAEEEVSKNTRWTKWGDDFLFKSFNCFDHRLPVLGDRRSTRSVGGWNGTGTKEKTESISFFFASLSSIFHYVFPRCSFPSS